MDLTWKPLAEEEWQSLHPVPVGLAKIVTADDLSKLATGINPADISYRAALVTPEQLKSLTDQLHPNRRQVAETAEQIMSLLDSIPGLKDSPDISIVGLVVGGANLGLTLRDAEWKDAPALTLKILEQIDTLSRLVNRPIPIALSLVIKAANFGVTLCAQFQDAGELTGGLSVMGATTTCLTFQELQEKLRAMSAGEA